MDAACAALARHAPFARMGADALQAFVAAAEARRFADGETVLAPADGVVDALWCVLDGEVHGEQRLGVPGAFALEPGELFPVSALLGSRAVSAAYRAHGPTVCLRVPAAAVHRIAAASPPFAAHLQQRVLQLLDSARRALQADAASRLLADHDLEAPLARWVREPPLALPPSATLEEALGAMQRRQVGSVLAVDADGVVLGILTRHDVVGRVVLARRALHAPLSEVMTWPVHTLDANASAHDAALLMTREGVRHVPITEHGRLVGIVSERDLFAAQRLTLRHIGAAIDAAARPDLLAEANADIRRFVGRLCAQGLRAREITQLASRLNDRLTRRLVELEAAAQGLDLRRACWVAFGSEGREEQTIATDQDNGLVLADAGERARWLALGRAVNEALAACGIPLCRGGVMAGEPACCLGTDEWQARFASWIARGTPEDLLRATIFFDLRPVAGDAALVAPLADAVASRVAATPRFVRQMADAALAHRPPLNWHGGLAGDAIDLKLQGTGLFVEAARALALATGVRVTGTVARLETAGAKLGVPASETAAWVAAFEHLQLLRLATQTAGLGNRCEFARLHDIGRRVLREALRAARRLQQRLELELAH